MRLERLSDKDQQSMRLRASAHSSRFARHSEISFNNSLNGYGAEAAVGRWSGADFFKPDNQFELSDVGHYGQIKFRYPENKNFDLIVNVRTNGFRRDPRTYAYVVCTGKFPDFWIVGWLGGEQVVDREATFFKSDAKWVVPRRELRTDWDILRLILASKAA